jgi:kinesin family protein 11
MKVCIGGKTKTSIIATTSPAQCDIGTTLNTVCFAACARRIRNNPQINLKMFQVGLRISLYHKI